MSCPFAKNSILKFRESETFEIQEVVGEGASSVVYYAIRLEDQTEHLLKEYHPGFLSLSRDREGNLCVKKEDRELFRKGLARFQKGCALQNEFRKDPMLKNSTSNIQGIYSGYGTVFVAMTRFSGSSYERVSERSLSELLKRMKALAEVVARYHQKGYLHLDIKPENIFVIPETAETVMLFDFDSVVSKAECTPYFIPSYTKDYAPPEQMKPDAFYEIGEWSDIYAIGMVFFRKLTGRLPDKENEHSRRSSYSFDTTKGLLSGVSKNVEDLLTNFFRHTICSQKRYRWQSADNVIHALDQLLDALQPSSSPVAEHPEIRDVSKQISKLSRAIFVAAILICIPIGFLAFRSILPDNHGSTDDSPLSVENPPLENTSKVVSSAASSEATLAQAEPIFSPELLETETIEASVPTNLPTAPTYIAKTLADNLQNFRSLIMKNDGAIVYLDGSVVYSSSSDAVLNLETDFPEPLKNGYLAYDPYNDIVYLLAGGSLSIYDITDFKNPALILEEDGLTLCSESSKTPSISVLPDGSILLPTDLYGTCRINITSQLCTPFKNIYHLGSPNYAAVIEGHILKLREGEVEASIIPLNGSPEYSINLKHEAPDNGAVAAARDGLWFYWNGTGVCRYSLDGSVSVVVTQQDISVTDYQGLDDNNIWAIAANGSGTVAFYDNSLKSIRYIHIP